jgi:putative hemolysin
MFLKAFNVHATVEPPVTDEEIVGLIDVGTRAGIFEAAEKEMIQNVITLERQPVTSLMTPRTEIEWIDMSAPFEVIKEKLKRGRFSQLPVGKGTLDDLQGYVMAKSLLALWLQNQDADIADAMRKPLYAPESASILELLASFRESHSHIAIIIDEFGGIEGLVTTHDVAEAIVGELSNDQSAPANRAIRTAPDGSFFLDGRMSIFDFEEQMGLEVATFDDVTFDTVAGLALFELGRIPSVGEKFRWREFEFVVEVMERNRIRTLRGSKPDSVKEDVTS